MTFRTYSSSQAKSKIHLLSVLLRQTIAGQMVLVESGVGQDDGDDATNVFIFIKSTNHILVLLKNQTTSYLSRVSYFLFFSFPIINASGVIASNDILYLC